jgi:hypothetical protein
MLHRDILLDWCIYSSAKKEVLSMRTLVGFYVEIVPEFHDSVVTVFAVVNFFFRSCRSILSAYFFVLSVNCIVSGLPRVKIRYDGQY